MMRRAWNGVSLLWLVLWISLSVAHSDTAGYEIVILPAIAPFVFGWIVRLIFNYTVRGNPFSL